MRTAHAISSEIASLESRLVDLRRELGEATSSSQSAKSNGVNDGGLPMPLEEYRRYGRQMILSDVGLPGQLKLKNTSVLVVGAGGLGAPALLYLGGAGVGHITILDHDEVETSNLHRQVLHTEATVGMNKAESAKIGLLSRNHGLNVNGVPHALTPTLFSKSSTPLSAPLDLATFSLVLDCSDNAPTRYLLSDVCVAANVPLVSGAAIRTEGQVSVWNLPPSPATGERGPCLRCVFSETEMTAGGRCEDEGVLGPAVGVTGVLMAWEALKILLGTHDCAPRLLLIPSFRSIKLRRRQPNCPGCGPKAAERLRSVLSGETPWQMGVCDVGEAPEALSEPRVDAKTFSPEAYRIIDVRPKVEFGICSLPGSENLPLADLLKDPSRLSASDRPTLLVCRRGNDSLVASRLVRRRGVDPIEVVDLAGGLRAYSRHVDTAFPVY